MRLKKKKKLNLNLWINFPLKIDEWQVIFQFIESNTCIQIIFDKERNISFENYYREII